MASASFLAFANALNRGAHIRVSIVLNAVGPKLRRLINIWCFAIGAATAWYFVWFCYRFVYFSWKFNDISQGQDRPWRWYLRSSRSISRRAKGDRTPAVAEAWDVASCSAGF